MGQAVYGAHGHLFEVNPGPALGDRVATALSTLEVDGASPVGTYAVSDVPEGFALTWGDELVGHRLTEDSILLLLHWHINQRTIDASVERRTTFHAAAARSPRGHGLLLAAPMESGKTTTVTGLLRAGWEYLTDEAAGVDADGRVWAYPKPLTVDRGSWPLFPELEPAGVGSGASSWLVPATAAGSRVVASAQLRMVVFPAYADGGSTSLDPVRPSQAALQLAHSTFKFDEHGERDLGCVSTIARRVPAYRLTIGDLAEAVALLDAADLALGTAA
jgi:hypothetical protein